MIDADESSYKIKWNFYECKSFLAKPIFSGLSVEEFAARGVSINEISESSMVRKRHIPEAHDQYMELVQFTVKNGMSYNAVVLNLTDTKPYVVDMMREID